MSNIRTEYTKPLTRKGSAVQKYKLLKDLPGHKAGEVIETAAHTVSWQDVSYEITMMLDNPDWFAPLDEPASPQTNTER